MIPSRLAWLLLALGIGLLAWAYPELPDPMGSHFDGSGAANGFQSKSSFVAMNIIIMALVNGMLLGVPTLFRRIPGRMLNLPYKDYWLATPEREALVERRIAGFAAWARAWANALFLAVLHFVCQQNGVPVLVRVEPAYFGPLLFAGIALFLGATLWWAAFGFRPSPEELRRHRSEMARRQRG